jgi:hypothetical protein
MRGWKSVITLLPVLLTAFSPVGDTLKSDSYHNFKFLKASGPPQKMKLIRTDNSAYGKPVIEEGFLLTYRNRRAREVRAAGDFSHWKPMRMDRSEHGVWYCFITDTEDRVRYKFMVDGIWVRDPKNPAQDDDGSGSTMSVIDPSPAGEGTRLTCRFLEKNLVEFRIFQPGARLVSLVGDFNNWNPEHDMLGKEKSGIWRLKKRLTRGTYRYKYIVDGRWTADLYNENSATDEIGGICSVIKVK